MPKNNLLRCLNCQRRRKLCNVSPAQACSYCVRHHVECLLPSDDQTARREANATAELKAQVERLQNIVESLDELPEVDKGGIAVDRRMERTIQSLSRLCFNSEPNDGTRSGADPEDLLASARRILSPSATVINPKTTSRLQHAGFTAVIEAPRDLNTILRDLPNRQTGQAMVHEYATNIWGNTFWPLFGPTYPDEVEELYDHIECGLEVDAAQVAELFALLAYVRRIQERSEGTQGRRGEAVSDIYARATLASLEFEVDGPSFRGVRALACLTMKLLHNEVGDSHALAWNAMTLARAQAEEIGIFDNELQPGETQVELADRRLLAAMLYRRDGLHRLNIGWQPLRKLERPSLPLYLEDADLPPGLRMSPMRPSRLAIDNARYILYLSEIGIALGQYAYGDEAPSAADVEQLLANLAKLEQQGPLPTYDSSTTSRLIMEEQVIIAVTSFLTTYLRIRAYFLLIGTQPYNDHRHELIASMDRMAGLLTVLRETQPTTGACDIIFCVVLCARLSGWSSNAEDAMRLSEASRRCLGTTLEFDHRPEPLLRYNRVLSMLSGMPAQRTRVDADGEVSKRSRLDRVVYQAELPTSKIMSTGTFSSSSDASLSRAFDFRLTADSLALHGALGGDLLVSRSL